LQDEYNGVFLNGSTCISKEIIEDEYLLYCFSFTEKNGKYVCELCGSLFFPNSDGICQPISDENCEVSSGRVNECLLCHKMYSIDST